MPVWEVILFWLSCSGCETLWAAHRWSSYLQYDSVFYGKPLFLSEVPAIQCFHLKWQCFVSNHAARWARYAVHECVLRLKSSHNLRWASPLLVLQRGHSQTPWSIIYHDAQRLFALLPLCIRNIWSDIYCHANKEQQPKATVNSANTYRSLITHNVPFQSKALLVLALRQWNNCLSFLQLNIKFLLSI